MTNNKIVSGVSGAEPTMQGTRWMFVLDHFLNCMSRLYRNAIDHAALGNVEHGCIYQDKMPYKEKKRFCNVLSSAFLL